MTQKNLASWVWVLLALGILFILALPYTENIVLDDAYITFRYARNLADAGHLVYNLDQPEDAFASTAPAYAILLAAAKQLGSDIPLAAGVLGGASILLAAWALGDAMTRTVQRSGMAGTPWMGLLAGGLLAVFPLLWLALGMEGLPALALVLLGFWLAATGRDLAAGMVLGLAVVLRFDAAAAAAAWGLLLLISRGWRAAIKPLATSALLIIGLFAAMHFGLDVPLPSTLASKQAQVALGITGFFPNASYIDGAGWLAAGYARIAPLAFGLLLALAGIGVLGVLWLRGSTESANTTATGYTLKQYLALLGAWAGLHVLLYVGLRVTPYLWYYLPLVVVLCALAAVGVTALAQKVAGWLHWRWTPAAMTLLLTALLAGGLIRVHAMMQQQLREYQQLSITDPIYAVLPGSQALAYQQAGDWLAAHTPTTARVGVSDVGIVGYVSQRSMIDFWGLLDRRIADALQRRDIIWALYTYQPDYLALYSETPLFGYDIFKNRWFIGAYEPVYRVPAGRLTIYQRRGPQFIPSAEPPADAIPMKVRFDDVLELTAYYVPPAPWSPDTALNLVYYWRVLRQPDKDYTVFTHVRDGRNAIIATRDAQPLLGTLPTSQWQAGELIADYHPLGFDPLPVAPTTTSLEVGLYDETGQRLPVYDAQGTEQLGGELDFGSYMFASATHPALFATERFTDAEIAISGYSLERDPFSRGGTATLTLDLTQCDLPVTLVAELRSDSDQRLIWQQELGVDQPGQVAFQITIPQDEPATGSELSLRVRQADRMLYYVDAVGSPLYESLLLTKILIVDP